MRRTTHARGGQRRAARRARYPTSEAERERPATPAAAEPLRAEARGAFDTLDDKLFAALRKRRKHGINVRDLPRAARLTPVETELLPERLAHLLHAGILVERKRGREIVLGSALGLVSGRLQAHPDGYAFVISEDRSEPDYYVPRNRLRPAMHGDRVLVRVETSRRGRREARVIDILDRGLEQLVGSYHSMPRGGGVLRPQEERVAYVVRIPPGRSGGARDGDLVVARITRYPTAASDIEAEIGVVLGPASDPRVETEAVIYRYGLPLAFPEPVQTAAAAVPPSVPAAAIEGRLDLRHQPIVTVDGENARDFDDAVGIAEHAAGFRLTVSIADVAHYVPDGGVVDQEAAQRGTSVYFPDRVIAMLPHALSNGICSLNPGVDRLTKTVVMDFDAHGHMQHAEFYASVIRSAARLTYTDVKRILVERDAATCGQYAALVPMLQSMEQLCLLLRQRRSGRGSIDFDLPEAEVILDLTGRPEAIVRAERHIGHQIIEEFMLAANEAVARQLMRHKMPLLYRVHEPPDDDTIAELSRFLATFGVRLTTPPGGAAPRDFQQVLQTVAGRPEERLISTVLLRSMKQARYAAEPLGHFGLATDHYTHFTSPIRRYPDLVVHRILGELLLAKRLTPERKEAWRARLPAIAEASSRKERVAMEAEREVVDLKKVQFMQDKIGAEFAGFVSGVQPFGLFVELSEFFVEGLVHVSALQDDYYEYDERAHLLRGRHTQRIFRLGDAVRVRVIATDPERRRIDFQIVGDVATTGGRGRRHTLKTRRRFP
jgi:ribonuclease R